MSVKKQTEKAVNEMSGADPGPVKSPDDIINDNPMPDGFDPDLHATDKDGNPIKNKDGSFRKKPGAKKGTKPHNHPDYQKGSSTVGAGPGGMERPTSEMEVLAAAQTVTNLHITASMALYGEDLGRPTKEELTYQTYAWVAFFQHHGIENLSPNMMIVVALGMYHMPRLMQSGPAKKKLAAAYKKLFKKKLPEEKQTGEKPQPEKEAVNADLH